MILLTQKTQLPLASPRTGESTHGMVSGKNKILETLASDVGAQVWI